MKQICTCLILIVAANSGSAQIKIKPSYTITGADSAFFKNHHLIPNKTQLLQADSAHFRYSVSGGKVFTLPQDNMPWLKPDTSIVYNMPLKTDAGNSNMPNVYRSNNGLIIWRKKY